MFLLNQPVVRTPELFTSMPQKLRQPRRTVWGDINHRGKQLDSFLEGPVFDATGNLYVTDIPNGRVLRIDPAGAWEVVAQWDGEPNGLKFHSATELVVTDYRNGLMIVDVSSGAVRPLLTHRNSERFRGVNDLTIDRHGTIFFTDQGQSGLHDPTGRVYRYTRADQLDQLLDTVPSPNGIVLSPDENFLYVAVTRGNCVWRMPLFDNGSITKTGQFFTSYGPSGPDGLAMDQAGRLLVANPGLGYIWVLSPRAEPIEVIVGTPGHSLTNLAFGTLDPRMLYATDSTAGTIVRIAMDTPGAPVHRRT